MERLDETDPFFIFYILFAIITLLLFLCLLSYRKLAENEKRATEFG